MNASTLDCKKTPITERIQLVEYFRDSIAQDVFEPGINLSVEHRAELHCRLAEHRADPASTASWQEVRAKLFR